MRQDLEQAPGLDMRGAARGQRHQRERDREHDHDVGASRNLGAEQVQSEHREKGGDAGRTGGDEGQQRVQRRPEGRGIGRERHVGAEHHPEAEKAGARMDEARGPAVKRARHRTRGTEHRVGKADQQHDGAGDRVGDGGARAGEADRGAGQHDHAAADHLLERDREGGGQPDRPRQRRVATGGDGAQASRHGRRRISAKPNRASVLTTAKAAPNRSTADGPARWAAGPASAKPSGESAIVPSQL